MVGEPAFVLREAMRRLGEEARQRAAAARTGTSEHDFYSGVMAAAREVPLQGRSEVDHGARLRHESPSYRDGYLKVVDMAGAAVGHVPPRFPLPTPDRS